MPKTNSSTSTTTTSPIVPNTVLNIVIPAQLAQTEYQKILRKTASQIKLPGFRQGKAPTKLVEESVDPAKLKEAVLEKVLPELYVEKIKSSQKVPLTQPDIHPVKAEIGQDWEVEIHIAEEPEITLGNYQKIIKSAQQEAKKVIAETVQNRAKASKKAATTASDTTPATPQPAQPAATLTDEEKKDIQLRTIFNALLKELQPSVQELLVRHETRHDLEELARTLDQVKMSLDDYLQRRHMTFDQLSGELAATALARIQLEFIIRALGNDLKIDVTDQDIQDSLAKITNADVKAQYSQDEHYLSHLKTHLKRQKTLDALLTIV